MGNRSQATSTRVAGLSVRTVKRIVEDMGTELEMPIQCVLAKKAAQIGLIW